MNSKRLLIYLSQINRLLLAVPGQRLTSRTHPYHPPTYIREVGVCPVLDPLDSSVSTSFRPNNSNLPHCSSLTPHQITY